MSKATHSSWNPDITKHAKRRRHARPRKIWSDQLMSFMGWKGLTWQNFEKETSLWMKLEADFVSFNN
jgi:hypothetical protein